MPAEPACCPPEPDLRAFHSGELSDADCERVAGHLAECPRCAGFLDGLTARYGVGQLRDEFEDRSDSVARQMRLACDRLAHDDDDGDLRALIEGNTDYRVGAVLGSGGMGRVYAGSGKDGSGRVAMKVILPRFVGVHRYLARFETEARTLRTLDNIRVVRYLKLLRVGGCPILVMEYVAGESLHAVLRRTGQLPAPDAARHAVQILEALEYLAGFGIVHRDVKPGNCLITETGELKLVDFGIAKDLTASDELTATGHFVGTPAYMSPEQAARPRDVDPRSDLYSVGCVLYELLTGRPPFQGGAAEVIGAHATRLPVPPRALVGDVPRAVSRAVLRLLAKQPADRFQTVREAIAAIEPHARDARAGRSARRRVLVVGFALVAAAAAGLALSATRGDPVRPDPPAPEGGPLTVTPQRPFWFGSEAWREYDLRLEVMPGREATPTIYFHATGTAFSCLRLGARIRHRTFLGFEDVVGGRATRLPELQEFEVRPEKWVPVTLRVSPFAATCLVDDPPGTPLTVQLSRSQGRIGLGTETGESCQFRNIVVRDRAGATLWSGYGQ